MTVFDHQALAHRFAAAMNAGDKALFKALVTVDFVTEWPQSGERVRGLANFEAVLDHYPGGQGGRGHDLETLRARPSDAVKLVAPSYTFVAVEGGGNTGTITLKAKYPDGSDWWVVSLYHLRDGRIAQTTSFFAPVYPAPEWRRQWVEPMS